MGSLLAIDGGRSCCRAAVVEEDGSRPATGEGRGLPPLSGPEGPPGIVQVVGEAVALCEANPETIEAVSAGLAGMLATAAQAPAMAADLARLIGVERIVLTSDVVTAYAGALGLRPGVVVVAGTGAVALALSTEGVARADGWGHILGDAGGGYWVGRRGLEAALRAHDGRGGSALLAGMAENHVGPLDDLPQWVEVSPNPVATVAGFARHVAEAAHQGDAVAGGIWAEAAAELAASAAACVRRLFPAGEAVPVSWAGGLFAASDLLLDPFLERLAGLVPAAMPTPPAGDALAGAALLAGPDGPGLLARFVYDTEADSGPPTSPDHSEPVLT